MEPLGAVPVHPGEGGQLDIVDDAPGSLVGSADQLGLVPAVDRLRQGANESPTDPIDGTAPSSTRRSPYWTLVNWTDSTGRPNTW